MFQAWKLISKGLVECLIAKFTALEHRLFLPFSARMENCKFVSSLQKIRTSCPSHWAAALRVSAAECCTRPAALRWGRMGSEFPRQMPFSKDPFIWLSTTGSAETSAAGCTDFRLSTLVTHTDDYAAYDCICKYHSHL